MTITTIQGPHCELCGRSDNESLYGPDADQGYTGCCNELVCHRNGCRRIDGYHEGVRP